MGLAPPGRPRPGDDPQPRAPRLLTATVELDPEIARVLEGMLAVDGPPADEVPIEQARAGHEAESERLSGPGEPVAEVRDVKVPSPQGDIPVRVYRPRDAGGGALPLVVYAHGGGWMVGSIESFDTVVRALTNASGAIVASIGYRLAPEHPFPAGLDDVICATRWIAANARELGGDPQRLAIAGDSAGGNLATVTARRLRGELDFRLQALVYPVTDAGVNTPSYRAFGEGYGLTAASMQRFWNLYLDGREGLDPDASPVRAPDLQGCPPAFIITAEADPLRDEGEAYAEALANAGVPVEQRRFEGAIHGFWRWLAATQLSGKAVDEVAAALRAALA